MSKRSFNKDMLDDRNGSTDFADSVLSVNTLQQFAVTKKRCLSFHGEKITNVVEGTTSHIGLEEEAVETQSLWKRFYKLECELNAALRNIVVPNNITHVYNPLEYASNLHCAYLRKFLNGPKSVVFVGMNPGPNGMGQTGVPFGNITTVRNEMALSGSVQQPVSVHEKRPVFGLECTVEEPSGARLWSLFKKLAGGSLSIFAEKCFVHNFCPLICYDKAGRNITPNELKVR
ncbi:unnamed protein product [Ceratitis capitata]|uniref:(Mediterranean fruit fly) hypothetical protein n=1 Tax=Ceratitis capitata TaxID=7213 RepID=A0A811U3D7_CERCA|nr:unnamed protein product [Ceratitis capitata]